MMADKSSDVKTDLSLWCYMHPKEAAGLIRKAREVIKPFAKISLTTDCPETNMADVDSLDMPDFCITPQVRSARAFLEEK
jgi:hypothetical protein